MKDLKTVYKAMTKEEAQMNLEKLSDKWGKKYPIVINSWESKLRTAIKLLQISPRYKKDNVYNQHH